MTDPAAAAQIISPYAQQVLDIVWPAFMDFLKAAVGVMLLFAIAKVREKFATDVQANNSASLNRTVEYSAKAAVVDSLGMAMSPDEVATVAVEKVKRHNPEMVAALRQTDEAIRDKVIAKIPEAAADVAKAATATGG